MSETQSFVSSEDGGEKSYRCFHCDEIFTDYKGALNHFGVSELSEPICTIDAAKYREMEAEVESWRNESTPIQREIAAIIARHQSDLRQEEEKGYSRGLRDADPYMAEREATINALTIERDRLAGLVRRFHEWDSKYPKGMIHPMQGEYDFDELIQEARASV